MVLGPRRTPQQTNMPGLCSSRGDFSSPGIRMGRLGIVELILPSQNIVAVVEGAGTGNVLPC